MEALRDGEGMPEVVEVSVSCCHQFERFSRMAASRRMCMYLYSTSISRIEPIVNDTSTKRVSCMDWFGEEMAAYLLGW